MSRRLLGPLAGLLALVVVAGSAAAADRCFRCDVMYATDCNTGLWTIDLATGRSTLVGNLPEVMFDLAATIDGRLIGAGTSGHLWEVSACDATGVPFPGVVSGNALGADLRSTDLFGQGPPLTRMESHAGGSTTVIGGSIGPTPPDWCGVSAGDLAMSPDDFRLRTALECTCLNGGTSLQVIDPATGNAMGDMSCITDARGTPYPDVYGLAYESSGTLWAAQAVIAPRLLRLSPTSAVASELPVTGGYTCGFGLACLPCGIQDPCAQALPPPSGIGAALRVIEHGDPWASDIVAKLTWPLDEGAPRPPTHHFHVFRSTDPSSIPFLPDPEPLRAASWVDSTPTAIPARLVHFYRVRTADECERESLD